MTTQNIFFEGGFPADEATVLALKSDVARAIREATAGMRQRAVASKLKVAQSDVSKIHRGELDALSLERLIKLTVRLGIDVVAQWGKDPHTALVCVSQVGGAAEATARPSDVVNELKLDDRVARLPFALRENPILNIVVR